MIAERPVIQQRPAPSSARRPTVADEAAARTPVAGIPALAFGSGLTALGVIRSLHQDGITAYSVCPAGELPTKSRWYRPAPLLAGNIPNPEQLPEYLDQLPIPAAVLIPCSDDWTRAIADLPDSLKTRFPACVADPSVVRIMTDKWRFATMLENLRIPRPRTILVSSMAELAALETGAFENMFLKPLDSQAFARHHRAKAFQVENKEHALRIMEQTQRNGCGDFPILLQEYIPGPTRHYFLVDGMVDREGQVRAFIARRRLSQYPPFFGNSARSVTIPLSEVGNAVESMEKICTELGYRGIFDAEFKYDDRDGQFKIIEINARPWWFVEFATRCGVDLCGMAYRDALRIDVESVNSYAVGRCCIHSNYDLAAHLAADPGWKGMLRWMRSCRNVEDIVYRWDDLGPGLSSTFTAIRAHFFRILRPP